MAGRGGRRRGLGARRATVRLAGGGGRVERPRDPGDRVGAVVRDAVDRQVRRNAQNLDGPRQRGVRALEVGRQLAEAAEVEDGRKRRHTSKTRGADRVVQILAVPRRLISRGGRPSTTA
jgi:hypothetical protein